MAVGMRMLLVMLPEQVLAVIVPVRSPDNRVDVFPIHFLRVGGEAAKAHRFVVPPLGRKRRTQIHSMTPKDSA